MKSWWWCREVAPATTIDAREVSGGGAWIGGSEVWFDGLPWRLR